MTTWTTTDLANLIVRIESGGRPQGGASEDSGEIPSLGGENIRQSGGLALESVKKVPLVFFRRMTKGFLRDQDVLINKDGANTGKVGFYEGQFPEASINEHVFLLRGEPEKLDQRFLYYMLLSPSGQEIIRAKISGSAQPGLKKGFVQDFAVTVPVSIAEQHRIAEVLSEIDHAIEQTEALIAKHRRIKTGLMHDLLTRGIDEHGNLRDLATHRFKPSPVGLVPEEWEVHKVGDFTSIVRGASPRPKGDPRYYGGSVPRLMVEDITRDGKYVTPAIDFLTEEGAKLSRPMPSGSLIVVCSGTVGIPAILAVDACIHDGLLGFSRVGGTVSVEFLYYLFWYYRNQFDTWATHGGVFTNLTTDIMRDFSVALPPIHEQGQIISMLTQIDLVIDSENHTAAKLRRLKTGLMQDLLTGKVSVAPLLMV